MTAPLTKLIEGKEEALSKDIFGKAGTIIAYLGIWGENTNPPELCGHDITGIFKQDSLYMERNNYKNEDTINNELTIKHKGKLVFEGYFHHNYTCSHSKPEITIVTYVPGDWERNFGALYARAKGMHDKKIKQLEVLVQKLEKVCKD